MKHWLIWFVLLIGTGAMSAGQSLSDAILAEWLSPKQDSRVLIYKEGRHYFGKIVWGTGPAKDINNPNPALRTRELSGLIILRDFEFNGQDAWENGTIYDPRQGKEYRCRMTLKEVNSLNIRGYVGISLFGRTEAWTRVR